MIEIVTDNMDNIFELKHTDNEGTSTILIACGIKMKGYPVPLNEDSYYENRYCAFPTPEPTFTTSLNYKKCGNFNIGRVALPIW